MESNQADNDSNEADEDVGHNKAVARNGMKAPPYAGKIFDDDCEGEDSDSDYDIESDGELDDDSSILDENGEEYVE